MLEYKYDHNVAFKPNPHRTTTLFLVSSLINMVARNVNRGQYEGCGHNMYGFPLFTDSFLLRAAGKSKIDRGISASSVKKIEWGIVEKERTKARLKANKLMRLKTVPTYRATRTETEYNKQSNRKKHI